MRSIPWHSSPFSPFSTFLHPCSRPNASKPVVVGGCELILCPKTRDEYLAYDPVGKGLEWKKFWFHVGNFESPLPERVLGAPHVQENWTSIGPSGQQVECLLRVIAQVKNKGVTGDHVVFSFVSRRIQPLQHRQHPSFRYEGIEDATRMSPEPMAHSDVIRKCCKVLDNFDKSLKLPTLFWAKNPPENAWVSDEKHRRVLVIKVFIF